MKKIFALILILGYFTLRINAQVYQFTSTNAMVFKSYSAGVQNIDSKISLTIDISNKKIKIDSTKEIVYSIISTTTTNMDSLGSKLFKYKCTDSSGASRLIIVTMFSDALQKITGIAGNCAFANGSYTYTYELHKKNQADQ